MKSAAIGPLIESLPTNQEHFLKKFLLEEQLKSELHELAKAQGLGYLGPPFDGATNDITKLPLLRYFYSEFIRSFPLITKNPEKEQIEFWRNTVQPFIESFNSQHLSESAERKEQATKRNQVNRKVLSSLLLFYNSMIISPKDSAYFASDHLKLTDQGKLHKISKNPRKGTMCLNDYQKLRSLDDFKQMLFLNDVHLNIIAVIHTPEAILDAKPVKKSWGINPLQMFSLSRPKVERLHYRFVVYVVKRTEKNGSFVYKSHFISKSYVDFKRLELSLKKEYPFLMKNEIGPLPKKFKHDDGIIAEDMISDSSDPAQATTQTKKFHREKLRLALRGYLNTVSEKPEIVHCSTFKDFLDNENNYSDLSLEEQVDCGQRSFLEKQRLETQQEFQESTAKVIHKLSQDFDSFKGNLLSEPNLISNLFKELEYCNDRESVSPLLRSFVDWCKLEVAATIYQVFLTQDNSNEWLSKCRKFHKLFPYSVCYGILKYTNPVNIMSRLMDLLLLEMPSLPFRGENKRSNSLLSMAFIMLLDEDLEGYDKERNVLLESSPLNDPAYRFVIDRIHYYVYDLDDYSKEEIKEESKIQGKNLLLHILTSDQVLPPIKNEDLVPLKSIELAFAAYQSLEEHKEASEANTYVNIRQLWQLEIRTRDKNIMKTMWQEPELTRLIKKVLTLFLNPMISVMKKCDIHLVFRDWQAFMNDLMDELHLLEEGEMFFSSPVEMFSRFKALLDKHEPSLWKFMHNLYRKDDEKIFLGIIGWIEHFLEVLRIKSSNPERVTLNLGALEPDSPINEIKFVEEIDKKMNLILQKRRLLKDLLERSAHSESVDGSANASGAVPHSGKVGAESGTGPTSQLSAALPDKIEDLIPIDEPGEGRMFSTQSEINENWKRINENVINMDTSDIGFSKDDVEDFNLLTEHDKRTNGAFSDVTDAANSAILKRVAILEKCNRQFPLVELPKLQHSVHDALCTILFPASREDAGI